MKIHVRVTTCKPERPTSKELNFSRTCHCCASASPSQQRTQPWTSPHRPRMNLREWVTCQTQISTKQILGRYHIFPTQGLDFDKVIDEELDSVLHSHMDLAEQESLDRTGEAGLMTNISTSTKLRVLITHSTISVDVIFE